MSDSSTEPGAPTTHPGTPLAESMDLGRRVFECLSLGLAVFDRRLQVVRHNPAAAFLIGAHRSIAEALADATVDSRYQDWARELNEVLQDRRPRRFDQVIYRQGGREDRLLNLVCVPMLDAAGLECTGGTLVIEDVTAATSMAQRLAVSERMAAVGKLAARVAHELNNPLDGILRYLNLSLRALDLGRTERLSDYLQQARTGLMRMAEIVRELVEFSRSTHTAFEDAGINSIVEEAVKVMAEQAVRAGVSIVCTLTENMPAIRGTSLFQVFCNLIKNALDAMPDGGTLMISTERTETDVLIRMADTGIGLPADASRIFEPFFTTKPPGKGTGLGLAICREIVEKYNGQILAERRPEGGSLFTVRIPLSACATIRQPGSEPFRDRPPARGEEARS